MSVTKKTLYTRQRFKHCMNYSIIYSAKLVHSQHECTCTLADLQLQPWSLLRCSPQRWTPTSTITIIMVLGWAPAIIPVELTSVTPITHPTVHGSPFIRSAPRIPTIRVVTMATITMAILRPGLRTGPIHLQYSQTLPFIPATRAIAPPPSPLVPPSSSTSVAVPISEIQHGPRHTHHTHTPLTTLTHHTHHTTHPLPPRGGRS